MSKHSMRRGSFRHAQSILQRFLNRLGIRLHHPEALIVRLLGVVAGKIEQRALIAALRHQDVNARCRGLSAICSESSSSSVLAIFEVHRNVDIARNVWLSDIKLVEERGEESPGLNPADFGSDGTAGLGFCSRIAP